MMARPEPSTFRGVPLSLSQRRASGWCVVYVAEEVPVTTRARLDAYLDRVTAPDAVDLGALSVAHGRATQQCGGLLPLVCAEGRMLRMLSVTGTYRSLPVHPAVSDAVAAGPGTAPPPAGPRRHEGPH
jgi:hypothetical protein